MGPAAPSHRQGRGPRQPLEPREVKPEPGRPRSATLPWALQKHGRPPITQLRTGAAQTSRKSDTHAPPAPPREAPPLWVQEEHCKGCVLYKCTCRSHPAGGLPPFTGDRWALPGSQLHAVLTPLEAWALACRPEPRSADRGQAVRRLEGLGGGLFLAGRARPSTCLPSPRAPFSHLTPSSPAATSTRAWPRPEPGAASTNLTASRWRSCR